MVVSIMITKKEPLSVLPQGQTAGVSTIEDEINPAVYGIIFHPDLIRGTSLGKDIKKYTFFSYAVNEALHLSDQEKEIVMDCLKKISIELEHGIDKHSKALIAMNIELLLNYCMRFYERQFITRNSANKDALAQSLNNFWMNISKINFPYKTGYLP